VSQRTSVLPETGTPISEVTSERKTDDVRIGPLEILLWKRKPDDSVNRQSPEENPDPSRHETRSAQHLRHADPAVQPAGTDPILPGTSIVQITRSGMHPAALKIVLRCSFLRDIAGNHK
jgi:hypothetical protein